MRNFVDLFCPESLIKVDDKRKRHGHPARPPKGVKRVKLGGGGQGERQGEG